MQTLDSYVLGQWRAGAGPQVLLYNPATEEPIAEVGGGAIDFPSALAYARAEGGAALRELTFGARAKLLKLLSAAIHAHRDELIDISIKNAGTTRGDAKFDIDGASGTLAAYAAYGEALGDRRFLLDGEAVQLGRGARFWGQHIYVPRQGAAVHINAFNFPAWNMMEKLACAILAGQPVVEKAGTPTAMVAWRIARVVVESEILPNGAYQFIAGALGDLLDHVGPQDSVAFTGSSETAAKLRGRANIIKNNVRMNVEADSLNAAVLGPDVEPGSETFSLFINNIVLDIVQKTGQKCTAVRRVVVPRARLEDARAEIAEQLNNIAVGDPASGETRMGPLASKSQQNDVRAGMVKLASACEAAAGGPAPIREKGYFVAPTLFVANDPRARIIHDVEVFGPCATLVPADGGAPEAAELAALGGGGLVTSVYSNDSAWTEKVVMGLAPWHGRVWIGSDKMAEQAIPPGTVLPSMIHGGPGRAGGGEELGALRGIAFYLQRTAVQAFKGQIDASFGAK